MSGGTAVEIYRGPFTEVGLECQKTWTLEDLVRLGKQALALKEASQWVLGDLAAQVETNYGEDSLVTWADGVGISYASALGYRTVAKAFEFSTRVENLPWTHHREVAALPAPKRAALLKKAVEKGWSKRELKEHAFPQQDEEEEPTPRDPLAAFRAYESALDQFYKEVRKAKEKIAKKKLRGTDFPTVSRNKMRDLHDKVRALLDAMDTYLEDN